MQENPALRIRTGDQKMYRVDQDCVFLPPSFFSSIKRQVDLHLGTG
jgi:hypothetical protein